MKVTVIGGTGVFGERLCILLARDGHDLTVAARNLGRAQVLAQRLGARGVAFDRQGDLEPLRGAEVVVDAAGPFRVADDWRVARWCIAAGIHYLDLSDDAAWTAGVAVLDSQARAAGVCVLSGLSSVPGMSSAVVTALAAGMDRIDLIDSAILPGNRAPRGPAVMDSILSAVGRPFWVTKGGRPVPERGWSDPVIHDLGPGLRRRAHAIAVPDQTLFPHHFGAVTVTFRAGLELRLMQAGLAVLSRLCAPGGVPRLLHPALRLAARMLAPFGTDRGGMVVTVTGQIGDGWITRRWQLVAEAGEGPFVPAVAVRALLRRPDLMTAGAGPALGRVPLDDLQQAMQDLAIRTDRTEQPHQPLFRRLLGPDWHDLARPLRDGHDLGRGPRVLTGTATISRGTGRIARAVAWLVGFPPAGNGVPVTVTMEQRGQGEVWTRDFGGRLFRSHLTVGSDGRLRERFGLLTFSIALRLRDGALHFPVTAARLGPVPLPRWLLPVSTARETDRAGRFSFDVRLSLPLRLGLLVHYRGQLDPVRPKRPSAA